jgi:hypothetical protein
MSQSTKTVGDRIPLLRSLTCSSCWHHQLHTYIPWTFCLFSGKQIRCQYMCHHVSVKCICPPSKKKRVQFSFFGESNNFKFDQIYNKKALTFMILNKYRWLIMEYIFIANLFRNMNIDIIFNKFSHTSKKLVWFKSRITLLLGWSSHYDGLRASPFPSK